MKYWLLWACALWDTSFCGTVRYETRIIFKLYVAGLDVIGN